MLLEKYVLEMCREEDIVFMVDLVISDEQKLTA